MLHVAKDEQAGYGLTSEPLECTCGVKIFCQGTCLPALHS